MEFEDYVDDLYFTVLIGEEELFPISGDLISSADSSLDTFCEICVEEKECEDMFASNICSHAYCKDCIGKHIAAKIQENILVITCPAPNCSEVLEPQICQPIIPTQVFERWCKALCDSLLIGVEQIIYCPFNDCQTPLIQDDDDDETVIESECPSCRRLFCAQCKVPWHADIGCNEFQSMNENDREQEDVMLVALSKKMKWGRCSYCMFFVERTEGCPHITCRCGHEFCYNCDENWRPPHLYCKGIRN